MFVYSKNNLSWMVGMLEALPAGVYDRPSILLSQATIGQHTRHTIEMYRCLLRGYDTGVVDYDRRERDHRIETDIASAIRAINEIMLVLDRENKPMQVHSEIDERQFILQSTYEREIMYNLDHAIHHMALIKVAVIEMTDIILPKEFGVAPTTLQYRSQCVQ